MPLPFIFVDSDSSLSLTSVSIFRFNNSHLKLSMSKRVLSFWPLLNFLNFLCPVSGSTINDGFRPKNQELSPTSGLPESGVSNTFEIYTEFNHFSLFLPQLSEIPPSLSGTTAGAGQIDFLLLLEAAGIQRLGRSSTFNQVPFFRCLEPVKASHHN